MARQFDLSGMKNHHHHHHHDSHRSPVPTAHHPSHHLTQHSSNHHSDHHHHSHHVDATCGDADHVLHSHDVVTTLRSELAASSYKRDRLLNELAEIKSSLCSKDTECESLRAQTARQSSMITSLQSRLSTAESRERNNHAKSEANIQSLQREKVALEAKHKEMHARIRRMECELSSEENSKEQMRTQLHDLVRRLCICLGIDVCDSTHLTPESVLTKTGDMVTELQRLRTKLTTTCENLTTCESEILNIRSISSSEKQRLQAQIEHLQTSNKDLEGRCHHEEKNVEATRNRLNEVEVCNDKLREELRGFESRCGRLQNTIDRFQSDRLQFLRNIASIINVPEPCETLIKDKTREMVNEIQTLHSQNTTLRDQLSLEGTRHRESMEAHTCRLRNEEQQKCVLEDRIEKTQNEIQLMRSEHLALGDFLVRLARALCWSECGEPPTHGPDTQILAESLIERAERLALHHDHHDHHNHHSIDHHGHHHHHNLPKLRRERSCHDLPAKESSAMYALQRRVRVLREQVQRRDLHLELLKRKVALLEEGARGKTMAQGERDDALNRARRSAKQAERTSHQLIETKAQLAEIKAQLAEAAEYKIASLERARKIDELQGRIMELENERGRLLSQISTYKTRVRSATESSTDKRMRDEAQITSLRDELSRIKTQLAEANHRLSQLQVFRGSVARILHLRDLPEADILQRLQTLCNAHQEFTLLSRRYEAASPVVEPCSRFDDIPPPPTQCRPLSSSPAHHHHHGPPHHHHLHHHRRYDDAAFNDEHFLDNEFDLKTY